MSEQEKAQFMAMGYKAKMAARKQYGPELAQWEIFRRTFGFYCWQKKNRFTEEQLACFAEGFKHEKPASATQPA